MRMPFAIWSGILAVLVYAGLAGMEYLNFGAFDPMWPTARLIGAIWLGLVVLVAIFGALRRSMTVRPGALPEDVARELKQQGKTKYVGVTHYLERGLDEMERILRNEPLDFIQINYSINAPQAAETVLPLARDKGVAVLINRAFDDGDLFAAVKDKPLPGWASDVGVESWAQMFLKFALSHPAVTSVIPATSKPKHQRDNLQAGYGPLLSDAQKKQLIALDL